MNYDDLIEGLKLRGFVGTEGICNKGDCHKNDCHFILHTDGLVIYSNFWNWNDDRSTRVESWPLEVSKFDHEIPFQFWMLDRIMGKS
jgi:hypothetical protein